MLSKAKVAVCSDIRTKHSTQSERHAEFLNVKSWWYVKKPLGFKRLNVLYDFYIKEPLFPYTALLGWSICLKVIFLWRKNWNFAYEVA